MIDKLIKLIIPKNWFELFIRFISIYLLLNWITNGYISFRIKGIMLLVISLILLFVKVDVD